MMNPRNFLWLGLFVLGACAKITPSAGGTSETHFLAPCDASCPEGLSCLCGVCTESCDSDAVCEALSGDASCKATADGCGAAMICDMECDSDGDCAALSDSHACEAGRCRAPASDPVPGDGDGDGDGDDDDAGAAGSGGGGSGGAVPVSGAGGVGGMDTLLSGGTGGGGTGVYLRGCEIDTGVVRHLLEEGASLGVCPTNIRTPSECTENVQNSIDAEQGFLMTWDTLLHVSPYLDISLTEGVIGTPSDEGYKIYKVVRNRERVSWTDCIGFTMDPTCEELADCFHCEALGAQECSCGTGDDPLEIVCNPYEEPNFCEEQTSCLIDSICYPDGETTEDGCCGCDNGQYSCIEPAGCPGWPSISKRCDAENGCGMGLECRSDLIGEQGVCTRTCNYGCPTGTSCFNNLVDSNGQPVDEGLCLRPCESNDDCALEVNGEPLGTLCHAFDENNGPAGGCL